jgi:hypothetical protein
MYACVLETGRGFFEGVCAPGNASAYFRDPPPPCYSRMVRVGVHTHQRDRLFCDPPLPLDSRIALFQRCGKSNTEVYIRAFYLLVFHQSID